MGLRTTLAAAIAGVGGAAALSRLYHYAGTVEPNRIEIPEYDVLCPDLPPSLDGFVICQLSDLHITAWKRNQTAIATAVRSVKADLYALTGDMIFRQSGIAAFLEWFDALGDAVRPAVAILGNAEHKDYVRKSELEAGLRERGVPLLNNESLRWPVGDGVLQIVGVDDPHTYHSDFAKAYQGTDPGLWTLLLCHSPDGARERAGLRADLMLCGHTHGGAIRVPPVGALIHGTTHVKGLVAGWYEDPVLSRRGKCPADRTRLYVSRGLGMSSWRFRLNCLPEMPLFRLRRAANRTIVRTSRRLVS
jgi:uncharacterized protein